MYKYYFFLFRSKPVFIIVTKNRVGPTINWELNVYIRIHIRRTYSVGNSLFYSSIYFHGKSRNFIIFYIVYFCSINKSNKMCLLRFYANINSIFIGNLQVHFLFKGHGYAQTNDFANVEFLQFLHVSFENENF